MEIVLPDDGSKLESIFIVDQDFRLDAGVGAQDCNTMKINKLDGGNGNV